MEFRGQGPRISSSNSLPRAAGAAGTLLEIAPRRHLSCGGVVLVAVVIRWASGRTTRWAPAAADRPLSQTRRRPAPDADLSFLRQDDDQPGSRGRRRKHRVQGHPDAQVWWTRARRSTTAKGRTSTEKPLRVSSPASATRNWIRSNRPIEKPATDWLPSLFPKDNLHTSEDLTTQPLREWNLQHAASLCPFAPGEHALARPTDGTESDSNLPQPELNPLLNPVLGQHMGRWAEVYFTSPPEKREAAVLELLRELRSNSNPQPEGTAAYHNEVLAGNPVHEMVESVHMTAQAWRIDMPVMRGQKSSSQIFLRRVRRTDPGRNFTRRITRLEWPMRETAARVYRKRGT